MRKYMLALGRVVSFPLLVVLQALILVGCMFAMMWEIVSLGE